MPLSSRDGALVLVSAIVGGALGAFGWSQLANPTAAAPSSNPSNGGEAQAAPTVPGTPTLADLQLEVDRLRKDNEALTNANSRREVAASPATMAKEDAEAEETAFERLDAGGIGDALDKIDFALIGQTSKDLMPLIEELAAALEAGEEMPLDLVGKIQALNGGLISEASKMLEAGIQGAGVNGSYTHPAVAGNRIMATLEAAGLGLDDEQRSRLSRIMDGYGNIDRSLRIVEASQEFAMESLIEEVAYKQKFFDDVRGMLGADQSAVLGDPSVAGRLQLGIHGPGLVLAQYARPIPVSDRGSMVDNWTSRLGKAIGASGDAAASLRRTVDQWAGSLPDNYFDTPADGLERQGMMHTSRVQQAAKRQLQLMRAVLAEHGASLTAEQREALTSGMRIMVPLPQ